MLTIQLPNGKTAEISVRNDFYLHTPNHTYIFTKPGKNDGENAKSVTTNIAIEKNQGVQGYKTTTTESPEHEFIRTLRYLEEDCGPAKNDEMGVPDIDLINRW